VVDEGELEIKKTVSLGQGLAVTPNIHVGSEEGSKAFVQTSTGAIEVIEQINPGQTKSGVTSWQEQ
jgi:type IV pilus assembly protein PilY1